MHYSFVACVSTWAMDQVNARSNRVCTMFGIKKFDDASTKPYKSVWLPLFYSPKTNLCVFSSSVRFFFYFIQQLPQIHIACTQCNKFMKCLSFLFTAFLLIPFRFFFLLLISLFVLIYICFFLFSKIQIISTKNLVFFLLI